MRFDNERSCFVSFQKRNFSLKSLKKRKEKKRKEKKERKRTQSLGPSLRQ